MTDEFENKQKEEMEALNKLFEDLEKLSPGPERKPIVDKILYLAFGGVRESNDENRDHPHWDCGNK